MSGLKEHAGDTMEPRHDPPFLDQEVIHHGAGLCSAEGHRGQGTCRVPRALSSQMERQPHVLLELADREIRLKVAARHLELDPELKPEADLLYRRADQVRAERKAMAERCER